MKLLWAGLDPGCGTHFRIPWGSLLLRGSWRKVGRHLVAPEPPNWAASCQADFQEARQEQRQPLPRAFLTSGESHFKKLLTVLFINQWTWKEYFIQQTFIHEQNTLAIARKCWIVQRSFSITKETHCLQETNHFFLSIQDNIDLKLTLSLLWHKSQLIT